MDTVETERLILRRWLQSDLDPFAAMGRDQRVMEFFPGTLTREESAALIKRIESKFDANGICLWALERKKDGAFIGFTGLNHPNFAAHFTPCIEVGWRLAFENWGQGYAYEAARASLAYAFDTLGEKEVVSFTAVRNERSRAVMKRLGMTHNTAEDFEHPELPEGHSLRRHVLYRIRQLV